MPKTKDALVRYRLINRCLLAYRFVTMETLMEACYETFDQEVSRRTIDKDIHDMRYDNALGYFARSDSTATAARITTTTSTIPSTRSRLITTILRRFLLRQPYSTSINPSAFSRRFPERCRKSSIR